MNAPWRTMRREERVGWLAGHWRLAVPALVTLAATLLMSFPLFTPSPVLPHLAMLSVLIWALFQPQLMPPWLALPLGLVADAALGLPLGVNALALPLLALVVGEGERRAGQQPFFAEWAVGALTIVAYQLLTALLLTVTLGARDVGPLMLQAAATILAYPPAVGLAAKLQRGWA